MTERPRHPRSTCCIPFCPRWSTLFPAEWMCARHYRLVDRALKRYWTKRMRAFKGRYDKSCAALQTAREAFYAGVGREMEVWRQVERRDRIAAHWNRSSHLLWRRMKRQATERSVGLA